MKLTLPVAPGDYDPNNEAQARNALEQADLQNLKRGDVLKTKTQPPGDNTTKVATTAFVAAAVAPLATSASLTAAIAPLATSASVASLAASVSTLAGRNRIENGAFTVNQYSPGGPIINPASQYVIDRWQLAVPFAGSVAQVTAGVGYFFLTNGSAQTPGGADLRLFNQKIEGSNIRDLGWGFPGASPVTLSFRVYCSISGLFGGCIRNGAGNYSYPFTFNIPSANTWTNISLTIPGPTAGTWATDNTSGLEMYFDLGTGSGYRGPPGAWAAANYVGVNGIVNWCGTAGAQIYFSNVQLEAGSVATPFEYRPYGTELALCQRHYEVLFSNGSNADRIPGYVVGTSGTLYIPFQVAKRVIPTLTASAPGTFSLFAFSPNTAYGCTGMSSPIQTYRAAEIDVTTAGLGGAPNGSGCVLYSPGSSGWIVASANI